MRKKIAGIALLLVVALLAAVLTGCTGSDSDSAKTNGTASDQEAADEVAALIDAIYVQERPKHG